MPAPILSISIVSHLQGRMVGPLLEDIQRVCPQPALEVLLTLNLPEQLPFQPDDFSFPVVILRTPRPLGFGANHNRAFRRARGDYFAVLNPDLRLSENPFPVLCADMKGENPVGVIAPGVEEETRKIADNARRFPTPLRILKRILRSARKSDYPPTGRPIPVDWLAGLFLLFPSRVFAAINGFDERYFLYCEDVDLCARLRLAGQEVLWDPRVSVIHQAQRHSHRRLKHLRWHVVSLIRFFRSEVFAALGLRLR